MKGTIYGKRKNCSTNISGFCQKLRKPHIATKRRKRMSILSEHGTIVAKKNNFKLVEYSSGDVNHYFYRIISKFGDTLDSFYLENKNHCKEAKKRFNEVMKNPMIMSVFALDSDCGDARLGPQDNTLDIELWKRIKGYDNYSVSSNGRVKRNEKILKPDYSSNESGKVMLYKQENGLSVGKSFAVSRLVMMAFGETGDMSGSIVAHKDGNKQNNAIENLCLISKSE